MMISKVPKSNRIHIEKGISKAPENFYDNFERILLKTPFEDESKSIFDKLLKIKNGNAKILEEERRKRKLKKATELKSLAESLLVCKTGGIIELKGLAYSFKITHNISTYIENKLEEEYKNAYLNYEPMTFEEGKEILEGNLCEDVAAFIDNYWHEWANAAGLTQEEMAMGHDYEIDDELIETYIEGQELSKAITPEQIRGRIKTLENEIKSYTKKGAPIKNLKLHCAILVFQESGRCEGKANDFRIIYECIDYMGLIDKNKKEEWIKKGTYQPEIQYLKSVYKEALKYSFKFYTKK